jgi:hypothetical protein
VFGMGTGDPSRYGHRQNVAFSGREAQRAANPAPSTCASREVSRPAFELEWRLAGGCPQLARDIYSPPQRLCLGGIGTRGAIWRHGNTTNGLGNKA